MAALTTTILVKTVMGNKRVHFGRSTNSGTGGEIDTGLRSCEMFIPVMNHSSVMADSPAVNETFPCDGSAVTVVTTNAPGGSLLWMAIGY